MTVAGWPAIACPAQVCSLFPLSELSSTAPHHNFVSHFNAAWVYIGKTKKLRIFN